MFYPEGGAAECGGSADGGEGGSCGGDASEEGGESEGEGGSCGGSAE